jgi:hypothetical protein
MLIENKNIEDSYGMGMLCNQQNKKKMLSIRKNCLTSLLF